MARAARLVAIGMVLGLAGSLAAGRVLASLLPGAPVHNAQSAGPGVSDPRPQRGDRGVPPRTSRCVIDPLIALRAE